jgi:hypothetical protein
MGRPKGVWLPRAAARTPWGSGPVEAIPEHPVLASMWGCQTYMSTRGGGGGPETMILAVRPGPYVAEPLELFRLKCAIDRHTTAIRPTHFKRNNPLVCRVSA